MVDAPSRETSSLHLVMSIESTLSGSLSLSLSSNESSTVLLVSFKGGKSAISRSARSSIKRREFSMSASGFSRCLFLFSSPLLFSSRIFSELMFHYRSWRIIVRVLDIVLDQPVVDIHSRRSFRSRGGIIFPIIVSMKPILLSLPQRDFLPIFFSFFFSFYRNNLLSSILFKSLKRRIVRRSMDRVFSISVFVVKFHLESLLGIHICLCDIHQI